MDFGALPPEVNSGLLFTGPGPSALIEAARAWNTLSIELSHMAGEHTSAVTVLAGSWIGPSAAAANTALSRFAGWLHQAGMLAEQSGGAALRAVEAYSVARAATVAPVEVAANRGQLVALIASNVFGQNTAAIAATEAVYAEMWAQDAAAMYGYASAARAATADLPTFTRPQSVSGSAQPGAAASPLLQFIQTVIPGFVPGAGLQNAAQLLVSPLSVAVASSGVLTAADPIGLLGPLLGLAALGEAAHAEASAQAAQAAAGAVPRFTVPSYPVGRSVVAVASSSGSVGGLSVPPSWAQPQGTRSHGAHDSMRLFRSKVDGQTAIPAVPFMPVTGMRSNQGKVRTDPEYGHVSKVLPPRHPAGA